MPSLLRETKNVLKFLDRQIAQVYKRSENIYSNSGALKLWNLKLSANHTVASYKISFLEI